MYYFIPTLIISQLNFVKLQLADALRRLVDAHRQRLSLAGDIARLGGEVRRRDEAIDELQRQQRLVEAVAARNAELAREARVTIDVLRDELTTLQADLLRTESQVSDTLWFVFVYVCCMCVSLDFFVRLLIDYFC